MSNRRYFTEDFKIDIKATPKKVDIKADGDEAKEVEDLAKSMFGDDFDFFATFDEEDKATEEVDEPIDNGFEDEEEVEAEEITEADEDADFFDIEYDLDGKYDEDEAKAIRSKRAASELELEFDDIKDEADEVLTETKKDPAYGKFDDIYDELDVTAKTGYKGGVDGKGHKVLAEPGERYDAVSEMGIGPNNTIRVFSKDPERLNFAKKVADFFGAPYEEHSIPGSKFAVDIDYMNTKVTEACKAELDEESEIERAINNFDFGGKDLKECGPIEEGSVRTIQDSGFDWGSSHYYLIDDPDTNLTSYHISDGVDKVSKDGIPARKALREILDFIKSHLKNRKDISLVWTDSPKDDGSGDVIVSIYSNWERDGKYPRTLANWSEAERMIRNALHLHNGPMTECGPIEEKCEEKLELKEEDCDCCEKCPECEELENMSKEDLIALVKELRK